MKRTIFAAALALSFALSSPVFAQCAGCGADTNKADREKTERESRGGSTIDKAREGLERTSQDRSLNENADRQLRELEQLERKDRQDRPE